MRPIEISEVREYVEKNIGSFHKKRLASLEQLELSIILKRKNPYLFKAKNILTAQDLVKGLLDAYLSSQEETIFGDFLEGLAVFICQRVYNGRKSSAEGADLEFEKDNIIYVVSIKSGPNWGNSRQIARMRDDFKKAKRILRSNISQKNIVAINGCCYGREKKSDKGDYLKYKENALALAENRIRYFNKIYQFWLNAINIKNQKTRWGSCSRKGNLNFNYKIALLPLQLADYIIVHELCHLGEFNHSRKFWDLVGKTIPDYGLLRNELRKGKYDQARQL